MRSLTIFVFTFALVLLALLSVGGTANAQTSVAELESAQAYLKDLVDKVDSGEYILKPMELGNGSVVPYPVRIEEFESSIDYALAIGKITAQQAEQLRQDRLSYTKLQRDPLRTQLARLEQKLADSRRTLGGCANLEGSWANVTPVGGSTWVIRRVGEDSYDAYEVGWGNAVAKAVTFSGSTLRIEWKTGPGARFEGYYQWELDANCRQSTSGSLVYTKGTTGSQSSRLTRQ